MRKRYVVEVNLVVSLSCFKDGTIRYYYYVYWQERRGLVVSLSCFAVFAG